MNHSTFDRRTFLAAAAGGLAATALAPHSAAAKAAPERKRSLRIAHLTDTHIMPEMRAGEGVSACLKHVNGLADKPSLILTGGDHVFDAFEQTRERTQLQYSLFKKTLAAENGIPTKACIGNHDIWGWNKSRSKATGGEPDYGKKWATEALALPGRYYAFTQAGWKFIALDSVQPGETERGYSAYLDEEQLAWLKAELAATPKEVPVLVWSHVPVVSAMPMLARRGKPTGEVGVSAGLCHTDAGALVELFAAHPNVKVCLSGHLHVVDHVEIKGVHYHCAGAVSGNWWRGKHQGFPEGYAVVDLYDDGSHALEYVAYGWKAGAKGSE